MEFREAITLYLRATHGVGRLEDLTDAELVTALRFARRLSRLGRSEGGQAS